VIYLAFQFRFARLKNIRELEEGLAQQRLAIAKEEERKEEEKLQVASPGTHGCPQL